MALTPTYFLADFQSGVLYGETLPLENVQLVSSLEPGRFSADLDVRKLGALGEAWRTTDLLRDGKCTLVAILEGTTRGSDMPPDSTVIGEWWISDIEERLPSPIVRLSGPEFAGYYKHVHSVIDTISERYNGMQAVREQVTAVNTTGQNVAMDYSGAANVLPVGISVRKGVTTVWDGVETIASDSGFQWRIETGLELDGWSPRRVTRRLIYGNPRLVYDLTSVPLELSGPGSPSTAVVSFGKATREGMNATSVTGWGAGAGEDQITAGAARPRRGAEPVKSRVVTDPTVTTTAEMQERVAGVLRTFDPRLKTFTARFHAWFHTPRVGATYSWYADPQWTRPGESGEAYSAGWTWQSSNPEFYDLELVEV